VLRRHNPANQSAQRCGELELLPAVFDPQRATEPGAPQLHGEKGAESRIADPAGNLVAELQGEIGDVASGLAAAAAAVEGTWKTQRVAPHCPGDALLHRLA
jgi:putative selenate reductase molybdopterin-binding subunit